MHFINSEEFEMKALNCAIARTVSQIASHAGEGCHVPMIMALENHLDALLTMERKMLGGMQDAAGPVLTPPAPDVIDMTDPANWQEGDIVLRTGHDWAGFYQGSKYRVGKVNALRQEIYIDRDEGNATGYTFDLLREDRLFQWLRHGEVQS